jgi:hypothetical protein
MALPMTRPTKHKSGVYYLQKRVPVDLIERAGRSAVKISLRTKDPELAKQRKRLVNPLCRRVLG